MSFLTKFSRNDIFLFLCTTLITAAIMWEFGATFNKITRLPLPDSLKGELRAISNEEIMSNLDSFSSASLSDNGKRALIFSKSNGFTTVSLWEENLGLTPISLELDAVGLGIISGDGQRAVLFAKERSKLDSEVKVYLWEEGFSVSRLVEDSFVGEWEASINKYGNRVFLYAKDNKAYSLTSSMKKNTLPLLIEILSRKSTNQSQIKSTLTPISTRRITLDSVIQKAILSDGQLISLNSTASAPSSLNISRVNVAQPAILDDIDADRGSDILVFRPTLDLPLWRFFSLSGTNGPTAQTALYDGIMGSYRVGDNRGIPVTGDYNGDGFLDLALYIPELGSLWLEPKGNWLVYLSKPYDQGTNWLYSKIEPTEEELQFHWGNDNAKAVPADYDGDGKTDIAVYSPNSGSWSIMLSKYGFNETKAALKSKHFGIYTLFGNYHDIPVPADYNGDKASDLILWREPKDNSSDGQWFIKYMKDGQLSKKQARVIKFGLQGDIPIPADYNCDGKAELAVYRSSSKKWIIRYNKDNIVEIPFGFDESEPLIGDYDADGCIDIGMYSPKAYFHYQIFPLRFSEEARKLIPADRNIISQYTFGSEDEIPTQVLLRKHQRR